MYHFPYTIKGKAMATVPSEQLPIAPNGRGTVLLTTGGFAAAFAVAACCALPLLLAGAGLGTAWLGSVAIVALPYRAALLAFALASLAGGAWLWWRQHRAVQVCAPGGVCARPVMRGITLTGLVAGWLLLVAGVIYA